MGRLGGGRRIIATRHAPQETVMHAPARRTLAIAFALCLPALSGAQLTAAENKVYAGVYSNACGDPGKPMVRLYDDVMSVGQAGKVVTAKPFKSSNAHLGATPPPADFKTAFVGEVKGGDGLVFVLFHNPDGLFVVLEGGPKSLAQLGPGLQGQKLRHCDPNRNALPGAPAAVSARPTDLLRDPKFKTPYLKALGPLASEKWLTSLNGPAPEMKTVQAAGAAYQLASVCKPHDCAEHNTVLLYDATQGRVVGKVYQAGRSTLIGNPTPTLARELERLWTEEWPRRP
jgi:Inhibitor of vertebrate lysozyme (Ivy)